MPDMDALYRRWEDQDAIRRAAMTAALADLDQARRAVAAERADREAEAAQIERDLFREIDLGHAPK